MAYVFLCGVLAQVFIMPFLRKQYTMADLVSFDLDFGEQVQVITLGVAMFFAVFNFASAQDDGYASPTRAMTSQRDRDILNAFSTVAIYIFFLSALVSERVGESFAYYMPRVARLTQRIRGALRTKKQAKFAPFIRGLFIGIIVICLTPTIVGLVLFFYANDGKGDSGAAKIGPLNNFARLLIGMMASFFMCSNPKGSKTAGRAVYICAVSLALLLSFTLEGVLNFSEKGRHMISLTPEEDPLPELTNMKKAEMIYLFAITSLCALMVFNALTNGRHYIALHSDAQIDQHLQNSIKVRPPPPTTLCSHMCVCPFCSNRHPHCSHMCVRLLFLRSNTTCLHRFSSGFSVPLCSSSPRRSPAICRRKTTETATA